MNDSEEKHKIVYIIGSLSSGGAERHLVELMKVLDQSLFVPVIYCMGEKGAFAEQVESMGIQVKAFHYMSRPAKGYADKGKEALALLRSLRKNLLADRPHIVHTYLFWSNAFGTIAAKLAGVRLVITSRRSLGLFKDGKPALQWIENMMNIFTDVVTTNSQEVLKDTLSREKFVEKKVTMIYNGVDIAKFVRVSKPSLLKRELHIPGDHIVVTNVANLAECKGHKEYLEAAAAVLRKTANITFLLAGRDRGMYAQLLELTERLGIGKHVRFLGSRSDVQEILNITDIQVLCSYEEGFSNAIIEGMACSLPLIVTDVGGNAEAVIDGHNGLVVPPRDVHALTDALLQLTGSDVERKSMGRKGRERVEKLFNLNVMESRYKEMYRRLLGHGRLPLERSGSDG
ncbi:glycosyltransferase [Paenibacillus hemerocallicola]|uniref:Glycosyltransferase n=1 Tax=Paenibacillus hemerocallicola TaxID=1172614 RepID=A0A5C4TCW0_9BACL|nr:glycosyltransferase [Paenibacillus hemerocallicola]TNJ66712.1 glycosyltransferase [Paenibacillus hemerocallicola]